MSVDTPQAWLDYAAENLAITRWTLENSLLNSSLQNAQQAVEKSLKAAWACRGKPIRKTHSIADLAEDLAALGVKSNIAEDEALLLDSIYMPSKYPAASVLPDGMPDAQVAQRCLQIAERVYAWAEKVVKTK